MTTKEELNVDLKKAQIIYEQQRATARRRKQQVAGGGALMGFVILTILAFAVLVIGKQLYQNAETQRAKDAQQLQQWQAQQRQQAEAQRQQAEAQQQQALADEKNRFEQARIQIEQRYPALNPDTPQYNRDIANATVTAINQHVAEGMTPTSAMNRAVYEVCETTGTNPCGRYIASSQPTNGQYQGSAEASYQAQGELSSVQREALAKQISAERIASIERTSAMEHENAQLRAQIADQAAGAPAPGVYMSANPNNSDDRITRYNQFQQQANRDNFINSIGDPRARELITACLQSGRDCGRGAAPPPPPQQSPTPTGVITDCDSEGCWGTGGRYVGDGSGSTFYGPNGQTCTRVGDMMHCH